MEKHLQPLFYLLFTEMTFPEFYKQMKTPADGIQQFQ